MLKLLHRLADFLARHDRLRVILDDQSGSVYLERYFLLFQGRKDGQNSSNIQEPPFNLLLHHICRSDHDRALHDHPWHWASLLLTGGYWEYTPEGKFWRGAGSFRMRSAEALHRLELDPERAGGETWTLFFTGKRRRDWGFVQNGVWTQWQEYLDRASRSSP
ncbi:MAG: hypothetical protein KME45_02965 [Stenomitos rutilans HA7619-LM2]|nr:hypothetical protein [Stenomitos rutilans HA7619-LM2]MBW4469345.1 hypothetical protein [Stenomitos rutilans HA7619-LM2]